MVDCRRVIQLAFVVSALLLVGCRQSAELREGRVDVTLDGRTFSLEIAADAESRYQGLSDRSKIDASGGMVFVFTDAKVRHFVMRRCEVPIDIIFLGPAGRITAMHAMEVEPESTPEDRLKRYSSGWPAQFAIELAGGTLHAMDLDHGDQIQLPLDALKAMAR